MYSKKKLAGCLVLLTLTLVLEYGSFSKTTILTNAIEPTTILSSLSRFNPTTCGLGELHTVIFESAVREVT